MEKYQLKHSKKLYETLHETLVGDVASSFHKVPYREFPIVMTHGKGSKLYDVDENEYIDYILGLGPMVLGHAPSALNKSVEDQLKKGTHFSAPTVDTIHLTQKIIDIIPSAEMVCYQNSGTEANMLAFRIARAYTGKKKIIKFEGQYHGWSDEEKITIDAKSVEELGPRENPNKILSSKGQKDDSGKDIIIVPWNDFDRIESIVKANENDIAGIIMEPIMCDSGPILPKVEYLKKICAFTKEKNIVLIFDEVITGFRVSLSGAQGYYGITPDVTVLAKAIAGGYPFAVVVGKKEIMNCGVTVSGTFNGNPLGTAAALATIHELERPGVYERLDEVANLFVNGFLNLCKKHKIKAFATHMGSIIIFYFGYEKSPNDFRDWLETGDFNFYEKFVKACEEYGVRFTSRRGRQYISTAHTKEDIKRTLEVIDIVFHEIK